MIALATTLSAVILAASFSFAHDEPDSTSKAKSQIQGLIQQGPFRLSLYPYRALRREGLVSLRALVEHDLTELKLIGGLGTKGFQEIERRLAERGLRFGDAFAGRDVLVTYEESESRWIAKLQRNLLQQEQFGPFLLTWSTTRVLFSAGIITLNDLLKWTPRELKDIKSFEEINLLEILVRFRERGLMFGDKLSADIFIEAKPKPAASEPLRLSSELVEILARRNITSLRTLLRIGPPRGLYLPLDRHRSQQIKVALFERGFKPGYRFRGNDIPIIAEPARQAAVSTPEPLVTVYQNQEELGPVKFSVRTYNALCARGILSLRNLLALTERELKQIAYVGDRGFAEIRDVLKVRGLRSGDGFPGADVAIERIDLPYTPAKQPKQPPPKQVALREPLRVSADVFAALKNSRVLTLKKLLRHSRQDLFRILYFDKRLLSEIEWALAEQGLRIGEFYKGPDCPIKAGHPDESCHGLMQDL